jgi:hypothetical protein
MSEKFKVMMMTQIYYGRFHPYVYQLEDAHLKHNNLSTSAVDIASLNNIKLI